MNGQKSLKKQWKLDEVSLIFQWFFTFHWFFTDSCLVVTHDQSNPYVPIFQTMQKRFSQTTTHYITSVTMALSSLPESDSAWLFIIISTV